MKGFYRLILFCCFLPPGLQAQHNLDSLWQIWQNPAAHDTSRLRAIHIMAFQYVSSNPDSALLLARLEADFARQKSLKNWEARALNVLGLGYRFTSNYARSFQCYQESIRLLEEAGDNGYMSKVYGNMGDVYRLQSNYPKAIECIYKSLQLAESVGDRKTMADAYVSISTIYYDEPENYRKALEYLEKARGIYIEMGDMQGLAQVYSNFSAVFLNLKDYKSSLLYAEKALEKQESAGDVYGMAASLYNRAIVLSIRGMYQGAMRDFDRVINIYQQMGDAEAIADAYNGMGDTWIHQNQYDRAIDACSRALELVAQEGPTMRYGDACNCLYTAYYKKREFAKALKYLEAFESTKDSLRQNETSEKLRQMELERQAVADSLGQEKEKYLMAIAHEQNLRGKDRILGWLLLAGMIFLAIAVAFWGRMLYFRKRSIELQRRSDELEKQQLLNEITLLKSQVNPHFLFNSLSVLSSLVYTNAHLAEQFIQELSRSYRYILEQKDQSLVSLKTELEFLRSYTFLLNIRFSNKLLLKIEAPAHLLETRKIAPLTLQLLIENAVKHNRMSDKEPLEVKIFIEQDRTLVVHNRLQPRSSPVHSTGIGLQNIINRYALLCDRPVWAGESENAFVVKIPLIA
jgi:tetratricopeptide (TPR) repeat protein